MKHGLTVLRGGILIALVAGIVAMVSCTQAPQNPAPAAGAPGSANDNGRFQVVMNAGPQGAAVAFLVDSRTGETWIWQPPRPPAVNGFWSDIPRMNYPPQVWQQVFQMLFAPPTNAPAAGTTGTTGNTTRGTTGGAKGSTTPNP